MAACRDAPERLPARNRRHHFDTVFVNSYGRWFRRWTYQLELTPDCLREKRRGRAGMTFPGQHAWSPSQYLPSVGATASFSFGTFLFAVVKEWDRPRLVVELVRPGWSTHSCSTLRICPAVTRA